MNGQKTNPAGRVLIFLVRMYQATLSPFIGRQCKFQPTCSNYFIQAVEIHGAVKGSRLGLWRILRCNPFTKGGFDPVPLEKPHTAKSG
jgi:putative membrane protein insertion efficiency factor